MRFYRFKTLNPNSLSQKHKSFGRAQPSRWAFLCLEFHALPSVWRLTRAFFIPWSHTMAEPASTTAAGMLLAKYGIIIAGFAGAILSLTFLQGLTRKQAFWAFFTGFSSAIFCTPLAISFFKLEPGGETQYGVAFLIGLLAMNIIPLLKKALPGVFGGVTGGQ